jgi:hypothetical protein
VVTEETVNTKMDQDKYLCEKQSSSEAFVTEPNERLKTLSDVGNSLEIDNNIPPRRWEFLLVLIQYKLVYSVYSHVAAVFLICCTLKKAQAFFLRLVLILEVIERSYHISG